MGYEFLLQRSYVILDTLVLAFICGILLINRKKGVMGGGMGAINQNKSKKF